MKITIESTTKVVEVNGQRARLWAGHTEAGVKVVCYIWAISPQTHDEAINEQFARELNEIAEPHVITPVEPS
jgi:hypothetical protein